MPLVLMICTETYVWTSEFVSDESLKVIVFSSYEYKFICVETECHAASSIRI
jgi:hypothetical protein